MYKPPPLRKSSFEVTILNRLKGPVDKPAVKRRKVHMKTNVLTDKEYLPELKRHKEEDAEKTDGKKLPHKGKKKSASKKIDFGKLNDDDDDDEVDDGKDDNIEEETEEEVLEESEEEDSEDEGEMEEEDEEEEEKEEEKSEEGLIKVWKASPTNESKLLDFISFTLSKTTFTY